MNAEDVVVLMNKHVEMKGQVSLLQSEKQKLVEDAMPAEVRKKVKDIEAEFEGKFEKAEAALTESEEEIKAAVVSLRQTLSVSGLKADFHPGRVSWDAKGLEKTMDANPEVAKLIAPYKKQGKAYASFRFAAEK